MSPAKVLRRAHRGILVAVVATLVSTLGVLAYRALPANRVESRASSYDIGEWVSPPSLSTMFDYQPTLLAVADTSTSFYPDLVANAMGWKLLLDAQGGTGFVRGADNPSSPRAPFIDRLDRDAATYYVDNVLVDGGRNDLDEPPERVLTAAGQYLKKVHSIWPFVKIVIVLPAAFTPDVAPNYQAVAEGLRRAAESVGAYAIDPLAQQWYRDVDVAQLLSKDGRHLNDAGEVYYAQKIVDNLKQLGLAS